MLYWAAQVIGKVLGSELAGTRYQPLFPYFAALKSAPPVANGHVNGHAAESAQAATPQLPRGAFRVVADGYVTADNGTGIVHCAPAFGEDDMRVCLANGDSTSHRGSSHKIV